MDSEAFRYILKQYYKGKKDNINLILISLRELIIEKCKKYGIKEDLNNIINLVIHGVDSYSLEKTISFSDYMNIYLDIAFSSYKEKNKRKIFAMETEFFTIFSNNIKETLQEDELNFNLGKKIV